MPSPQPTTGSSDSDSALDRYINDTDSAWNAYMPPASGSSGGGSDDQGEDEQKSS